MVQIMKVGSSKFFVSVMAIDGVSRELIEEAQAGTFVEPENHIKIAEGLRSYKNDPDVVEQEGRSGYEFAKTRFDRRVLANKYVELINEKLLNV